MLNFGVFSLVSLSMVCSCIAPLTRVVMVMRGLGFHPIYCVVLISGSYLVYMLVREGLSKEPIVAICEIDV